MSNSHGPERGRARISVCQSELWDWNTPLRQSVQVLSKQWSWEDWWTQYNARGGAGGGLLCGPGKSL